MTIPITHLRPEECRPAQDAGLGALETERGNLPLDGVDVTARLTGLVAGVAMVQTFRNTFDVSLEATYVFPLPPRAAVTEFRMEAGDRVIDGVLKERAQARADYDRALAEGRRAAIAEEDRPDVFTIRVGNIGPGERVTVRLTLSQPLPYEDGAAEFRFPLVVAPRYVPGAPLDGPQAGDGVAPDTGAVPDASRISPPVLLPGFPHPVRLSLAVTVDPAGLGLREIRSSLHEVVREGDTIRLRPGERLNRDFILRLAFDASTALALVPDDADEGTFTLTVVPPADATATTRPRDVVLLLDRSGSMMGWKMVAARRAAARIVDTLTARDRFAVLAFDTVVERAFPAGLVHASDRDRYRAVEHLARLEARGGTEMLIPVEEALGLLDAAGDERAGDERTCDGAEARDRVLVLVTDGQVGNEDQILERAGGRLGGVRVHTVGIDRAVNAGFLGRLALLGGGRCELVESEDRLDEAMEHIHRRIGAPLVTDVTLHPEGFELVPDTVTDAGSLFPGVPLTVSGRYRGRPSGAMAVRGRTADGEPWERRVTGHRADGPAARAVWARAHLRRLEDRYAAGDHSLEDRIVAASLRFGVLCRFTAFVAVDSRVTADGRPEHHVIQPVEPPSGWDMPMGAPTALGGVVRMAAAAPMAAAPSAEAPIAFTAFPAAPPPAPAGPGRRAGRGFSVGRGNEAPSSPEADLDAVRPLLGEELTRLRAVETTLPERELRRYLSDLGSRLRVIAHLAGDHAELSALAEDLERAERPGTRPDDLLRRVIDVLTALTNAPGRRAFWKRS
ncbi:VIT domain-containing protein [Sphaerimonospora sp. CA-214678]|uniref:VIT domain-containing protein n=1 Tax=Sphaerimonospora sp. CA-214678 TaxID=3240029 RepID=UPI003D8CDE55